MACVSSLFGSARGPLVTAPPPRRLCKRRAYSAQTSIGLCGCSLPSVARDRRWYSPHRMRKKWFRPSKPFRHWVEADGYASLLDSIGGTTSSLMKPPHHAQAHQRRREIMAWSLLPWSSPDINVLNLNHFSLQSTSYPTHKSCSGKTRTLLTYKHSQVGWCLLRTFGPCKAKNGRGFNEELQVRENGDPFRRLALQAALWSAEAAYILWLFLLSYAPGDPVWSIKSETINDLLGLSLNFFFVLPAVNSAGIHVIEAPVLHPVAEGLFNFVIAWTLMFAPLLFTDSRRDRYRGSLDVLWGLQMFLTNTFLIPYMAIRLNDIDVDQPPLKASRLGSLMTRGASVVGLIGASVCLISALWALFGRNDGGFGGVADRWHFCQMYIGSERLAYAFVWDICLYSIFQPWLIGDNLKNVRKSTEGLVGNLRFVPVVGLVAYLLCLDVDKEL